LILRAFLLGAIGLAVQVVLFREALVRAGGDEFVLGGLLAGWLLAGAAGVLLARRPPERREGRLLFGLVVLIASVGGAILAWRGVAGLAGSLPGERQGAFLFALQALLWNGPAAMALGWLFALLDGPRREGAASLVGFEALGAAVAGIVLALPGVLSMIPAGEALDTRHGRFEAVERGGERWLRIDGRDRWLIDGDFPRSSRLALAALQLQVPVGARVLLVGDPDLLPFLLEHSPAGVDLLLADPALETFLREEAGEGLRAALLDPRVHLRARGLRAWLRSTDHRYGVIWLGGADPDHAETSRAVSVEGFRLLAEHLEAEGWLGLQLGGVDGVFASAGMERAGLIAAGCAEVGLAPVLLGDGTILAGREVGEAVLDPVSLAREAALRGLSEPLGRSAAWEELVAPVTLELWNRSLRGETVDPLALLVAGERVDPSGWPAFPEGARHTDLRPRALALSARISESHARGGRADWLRAAGSLGGWGWFAVCVGGLLVVSFVASRGRSMGSGRAALSLTTSSFAGAVGFLLLLERYQAETGVLFADLGWLSAAFLLGFAGGSRIPSLSRSADLGMIGALLGLVLWSVVDVPTTPAAVVGALAIGAAVGSPVAAAAASRGLRWAWSLDLAAAAPGAFLAGIAFQPLLGWSGTLFVVLGVKGVALVMGGVRRPMG
jgi:hypothetical protein